MKLRRGGLGPFAILLALLAGAGFTLILLALLTALAPSGQAGSAILVLPFGAGQSPQPAVTVTSGPVITQPPSPTSTLVVRSPTPGPTPTAQPTATWFIEIQAQPTPIPTPQLPPAAPFPASCDGPGRMNILLVGIDGFNTEYQRPARSDAIVVVGVNFEAKTAQMLSIPRDLWVQLPDILAVPEGRINTAYHYGELYQIPGGGPAELSAVVATTFGLRIDRYVVVSFSAFEQGIDTIGGIDLNIPKPLHDSAYPLPEGGGTLAVDFPAGWVHLDGQAALIYARIRHDSTDFNRMRRQQQVLFAIRDRLLSPDTLPQLPALAQLLIGSARTNLSLEEVALLGCAAPQIGRDAIQAWVIDDTLTEESRSSSGAFVLYPRMDLILPYLAAFNVGQ